MLYLAVPPGCVRLIAFAYCRRFLLKWISSLFSAANAIPLVAAHRRQVFQALCSWLILKLSYTRRVVIR